MTAKVTIMPVTITAVSISAEMTDEAEAAKNIEIIAIIAGNLPLQGTKLFVITARSCSRFESMMRQPVTAAALQPKPIHMVSPCLPQALHFSKGVSRLYAILGR